MQWNVAQSAPLRAIFFLEQASRDAIEPLAAGAQDVPIMTTLGWAPAALAETYEVYLWEATSAKPTTATQWGLAANEFTPPENLEYGRQYVWQVVARNLEGAVAGPQWTFTSFLPLPGAPANPTPHDGSTTASADGALGWADTPQGGA